MEKHKDHNSKSLEGLGASLNSDPAPTPVAIAPSLRDQWAADPSRISHSPGPWPEPEPGSINGWAIMTIEKDGLHVVVTAPHSTEDADGNWTDVAAVYEMEANARLISQAPAMVERIRALEHALAGLLEAAREANKVACASNDDYVDDGAHYVGEWIDEAKSVLNDKAGTS